MDSSIPPTGPGTRPDVVSVETTPRPTARAVGAPFSEVLAGGARAFVRGATAAARTIPGSPLMAVAVRNGPVTSTLPIATTSTALPEGPGALVGPSVGNPAALTAGIGMGAGTSPGTAPTDGGIESVMAQDQEMNLYYLQVQEEVNAQNRTFSALSNVMEVEHNTAKTAIGNIH